MLLFWIGVFIISLIVLVKGADWLLDSSERIGISLGLSPFIVGIVVVGLGTSFPELVSSLVATLKGVTEMAAANVVGSNIANILLVVGGSALVGGRLMVNKDLIDLDIPLLAISTAMFAAVAWDRQIVFAESVLLLILFAVYFLYTILYRDDKPGEDISDFLKRFKRGFEKKTFQESKIRIRDVGLFIVGAFGLILGSKYLVDSVVNLSGILSVGVGVISLAAVALGTSLPELIVSVKAILKNKPEFALGNIFGSNIFNLLFVVGVSGMFSNLTLDSPTFTLGLPIMAVVTLLFVISGISRRIHIFEGAMYLVVYVFFIGKLFNLF